MNGPICDDEFNVAEDYGEERLLKELLKHPRFSSSCYPTKCRKNWPNFVRRLL